MHASITTPANMTKAERDEFIAFVLQAGEVDAATLPDLVDRAVALVMMREGASLIRTAAIKAPNITYPPKVFRKPRLRTRLLLIRSNWGGSISTILMSGKDVEVRRWQQRSKLRRKKGLYATTKSGAKSRMLPKLGFTALGEPYVSAEDPGAELTLFVRPGR